MKKFLCIMLSFIVCLSLSIPCFATAENDFSAPITKEELANVFPEYSAKIEQNGFVPRASFSEKQRQPTHANRVTVDENTEYAIQFFDDNSYVAARYYTSINLSGGTSTINPSLNYRADAVLTVTDFVIGNNKTFTISGITYTINYNGYDRLNAINTFAVGAFEENGRIVNYTGSRNSYREYETSQYKANASYYINNNYLEFAVGGDSWGVWYNGTFLQ